MKKTRKFLVPFAALVSVFASNTEAAIQNEVPTKADTDKNIAVSDSNQGDMKTVSNGTDAFSFILKRSETGTLLADHYSHRSHSSHSSHSSHRSHVSGY